MRLSSAGFPVLHYLQLWLLLYLSAIEKAFKRAISHVIFAKLR